MRSWWRWKKQQAKLNKIRAAISERDKTISVVDEELKDLLRRAIADDEDDEQASAPPMADPNAAWQTINATLSSLAAQPGVPTGWAEQLGGLLEQVRMAAAALTQHTIATAPRLAALPQQQPKQQPQQQQQPPANTGKGGGGGGGTSGTSSSSSSSPLQPSSPAPPPANAAHPPAPAAEDQHPREATTNQTTNRWASRVHDLAFADGGSAGGGEQPANDPPLQPAGAVEVAAISQSAAAGVQQAAIIDAESELGSDDDMASVVGADLERQEDESVPNHKRRIARMLKERARRKKEEKQRDGRADRKKHEGKDGKEKVSQKKK